MILNEQISNSMNRKEHDTSRCSNRIFEKTETKWQVKLQYNEMNWKTIWLYGFDLFFYNICDCDCLYNAVSTEHTLYLIGYLKRISYVTFGVIIEKLFTSCFFYM